MIPLLFPADATTYLSHGIGPLSDCIECTAEEEANGAFTLKLSLPMNSKRLSDLVCGTQIICHPYHYGTMQPFRVKRVGRPLRGRVEVYAEHICYDLAGTPIGAFEAETAAQAVRYMNARRLGGEQFTFVTDLNVSSYMQVEEPTSAWSLIGPGKNTLLGCYGGELRFDLRTVSLLNARGADRAFRVRYGVNMTDLTYEEDASEFYTGVLPFWRGEDSTVVGTVQNAAGSFGFTKIMPLDLSAEYDSAPTAAMLNAAGWKYIAEQKVGVPVFRIKAGFTPPGARGLANIEDVRLFDPVIVEHERYGIEMEASVVKTVYNVLSERYKSIEIGNRLITVAQTIAAPTDRIKKGAVDNKALARNSVGGGSIKRRAVKTHTIEEKNVTGPKIADGAITGIKIGTGAVETDKIAAGAVTSAKLASGVQSILSRANSMLAANGLTVNGTTYEPTTLSYTKGDGTTGTITVLAK